jgi:hypothetical protein
MLTNTTCQVVFAIIIFFIFFSHKVRIYLEYHNVCPLVRIGTPNPSPAIEFVPPGTKGGMGGSQFGRLEKKPSTLSPLCLFLEAFA